MSRLKAVHDCSRRVIMIMMRTPGVNGVKFDLIAGTSSRQDFVQCNGVI